MWCKCRYDHKLFERRAPPQLLLLGRQKTLKSQMQGSAARHAGNNAVSHMPSHAMSSATQGVLEDAFIKVVHDK